eukprot:CAMPEP_0117554352 /NCGR_PEP_ID=MMETSP0784-20121206/50710_1 /TAXON_ID=39447 /ORGANISM="" /LENGTH=216 /DNA_ID=CAMNT_0005351515 /DNA_START=71 /DNA_END=721 /DNA_ORIENTATION=+
MDSVSAGSSVQICEASIDEGSEVVIAPAPPIESQILGASIVEQDDADRLAAWLETEDSTVQFAVDGGDFGRPITPSGIRRWWSNFGGWCRDSRSRVLIKHTVFAAYANGVACGHIEIGVMRSIDVAHNVVNDYCGMEPFALFLYTYIAPADRSAGLGISMVRAACEKALSSGAIRVVAIVAESNVRARSFWQRVGFKDTGILVEKQGNPFHLVEWA